MAELNSSAQPPAKPSAIDLRYENPADAPTEITIRTFEDGGVTIVIPPKKINPKAVVVAYLFVECLFLTPINIFAIRHHAWSILIFFSVAVLVMPPLLLLAISFPRKVDRNEVIGVSPHTIYVKPHNEKGRSLPRGDFQRLQIRRPFYTPHFTDPRHIDLDFRQNRTQKVCIDRTERETEVVATALQKAFDATARGQG